MIDTFTRQEFESALPVHKVTGEPLWLHVGIAYGEHQYLIKIDEKVGILVNSSIGPSGVSAASGENSIRAWLVAYTQKLNGVVTRPLGSKVNRWTTRLPGWQDRLIYNDNSVVRTLWRWRKKAGDCAKCGDPKGVFRTKKPGPNKGRIFTKCLKCDGTFEWITEEK
jgi:hypothetical protein